MKASDTVMSQTETTEFIDKWLNGEIEARHVSVAIAERQAEISFKAGIQEVVKWVNSQVLRNSYNPTLFPRTAWKVKLKEWGIE